MKIRLKDLLLIVSVLFPFSSCVNSGVETAAELSKLPAVTQSGANTFGCLIDGKAFVPVNVNPPTVTNFLQCYYFADKKGFHLNLQVAKSDTTKTWKSIIIATDSLALVKGKTFKLATRDEGKASAGYIVSNLAQPKTIKGYRTTDNVSGELKITKVDIIKRIIAGTFWFNATDNNGGKIEVRHGRFDLKETTYTPPDDVIN